MTVAPFHTETTTRPNRPARRFQPAHATLLLLMLSTGMLGYSATRALNSASRPARFHASTSRGPSATQPSPAQDIETQL